MPLRGGAFPRKGWSEAAASSGDVTGVQGAMAPCLFSYSPLISEANSSAPSKTPRGVT